MTKTMYVAADATHFVGEDGKQHALLWGDVVTDVTATGDPKHVNGTAHGHHGLLAVVDLQEEHLALLEIYVIDVGQGDAILIRSPDGCWHLVDGGPPKADSLVGEGARNFIAWKFGAELRMKTVPLQNVFLSHSDEDHFGGLTEILSSDFPPPPGGRNRLVTTVEHFLHAGVAKYKGEGLGVVGKAIPAAHLLSDHASFALPPLELADHFGQFAQAVANVRTAAGGTPDVRRVSVRDSVPGYNPSSVAGFSMHLLGPVPENAAGDLRAFTDMPHTVNGHSVVVRLDYGKVRVLLTGDINKVAQQHMLTGADEAEFRADVIKACHHGAEDIDAKFTRAVAPRVTIVSSGDNETYSHPRPEALGGYAYYGRRSFVNKSHRTIQPPLVYATEIARSIKTQRVTVQGGGLATAIGAVVFGLVNVRTDGERIVCAVRNEGKAQFETEQLWITAADAPAQDH